MKNFSSILTFLTTVALVCPMTACAVGKTSGNELSALTKEAYALGADTDYIGIASFKYNYSRPVPYHVYEDFLARFDMPKYYSYEEFVTSVIDRNGYNTGMSILNILAHNGAIKPSDIDENAENMADISYSENVGRIITGYESITAMPEFADYKQHLKDNFTFDEQVDRLITMAEKDESEKRYFLISYNYAFESADGNIMKLYNNVTGIGIAEGNWNFNGIDYDKCILTLDPNSKTSDGLANGFDESYCIYINSETKECYIPAYKAGGKTKNEIVFASIDDDTFFNYRGLINPSDKIEADIPHFITISKKITPISNQIYYVLDGKETLIDNVSDDDLKYSFFDVITVPADAIRFVTNGHRNSYRYESADRCIYANIINYDVFTDMTISDNNISVKNISYDAPEGYGHEPQEYTFVIKMKDGSHNFAPYSEWYINGKTDSEITYDFTEDGIIIRSPEKFQTILYASYYIYDEDNVTLQEIESPFISSVSDVLVKIDENHQIKVLFDDNDDGVFDSEMKKGDVNMDGAIDASDASEILAYYSYMSTTMSSNNDYSMIEVNTELGDVNSDGKVDAADASEVLAMYSEASTSN